MDCEILYFKAAAYNKLGFFCDRMNASAKFHDYYENAIKLKEEKGNILQEDFDRILNCILELDSEDDNVKSVEDRFNELFSEEFRR